jgi:dTDP-D-glucose 4,6-dehydratase
MKKKPVDTTVNLHQDQLQRLEQAFQHSGISVNELILLLFKRMMQENKRLHESAPTIQYQEDREGYEKKHVYMDYTEYDQKLDMRRMYKMSASLVLALAIDWFLEELLVPSKKGGSAIINAFLQKNYQVIPFFSQKYTEYRIIWGIKPK